MDYFCTLFDDLYLPRGLALYQSLARHHQNFHLYILAMDGPCYKKLKQLSLPATTIIKLSTIENSDLLAIKKQRSRAEYCWTLTPVVIAHCLKKYQLPAITYLDADIYFYASPALLLQQMPKKASVMVSKHNFAEKYKFLEKESGTFCVEFLTFRNTPAGQRILTTWLNQCLEECVVDPKNNKCGDQTYLNDWPKKYKEHLAIIPDSYHAAPWNVIAKKLVKKDNHITANGYPVIFYHFHDLKPAGPNRLLYFADYYFRDYYTLDNPDPLFFYVLYIQHIRKIEKELKRIVLADVSYFLSPHKTQERRHKIKKNIARPFFSIVTVCRNEEDYIHLTANSVTTQTCQDYEWLVIDGKSTDQTSAILKKYKKDMTYWVSEKDNGIYDAMNKGIKQAKGQYIIFMNGGDFFYDKHVLQRVYDFITLDQHQHKIYFGTSMMHNGDINNIFQGYRQYKYVGRSLKKSYFILDTLDHQATFINRTLFTAYGTYSTDPAYKFCADAEWFLRTIEEKNIYMGFVVCTFNMEQDETRRRDPLIHEIETAGAKIFKRKYFSLFSLFFYRCYYEFVDLHSGQMRPIRSAVKNCFLQIYFGLPFLHRPWRALKKVVSGRKHAT